VRQSLALNPASGGASFAPGNMASGYYADGFFVFFQITGANTAVSATAHEVAYLGQLFFNPYNYASLFFPAAGYRNHTGGELNAAGNTGMYWTSSSFATNASWRFAPMSGQVDYNYIGRANAMPVRCVKDDFYTNPAFVWLSPSTGNDMKAVQVIANGVWTLVAQPANAMVLPTSGAAGTSYIGLIRSTSVFGLSAFQLQHTASGRAITVTVDNYYIDVDPANVLTIPNNLPTGNTSEYEIPVKGGMGKFVIVSHSPWFTATVASNGKLHLTADQSPGQALRTGTITIAHANDPTYQVTLNIKQDINSLPPFDYLAINFASAAGLDLDIAVEFTGNQFPASPGTYAPFDNPYIYGAAQTKAVGYGLASSIDKTGAAWNRPCTSTNTQFSAQEIIDRLMLWGGDARNGEGETVFINVPQITPPSRELDNTGLPQFIKIEVYVTWYQTGGSGTRPMTVTVSTYTGGIMMKPASNLPSGSPVIFQTNFYNVAEGTTSLTSPSQVLPPDFKETYTRQCNVWNSQTNASEDFRTKFMRICTIKYDRYMKDASITWY
jgi:hypothetical protein